MIVLSLVLHAELVTTSRVYGAYVCLPRLVVFTLVLLLKKGEKSRELQGGTGRSLDAEMEKLLEDSVMCRARAKRGCATHPRSIAERVLKFLFVVVFIYNI